MKKFVPLLLCFSLSLFTVASATKPGHTLAAIETAQKHAKAESLDVSESDDNEAAGEQDTDQGVASNDDGGIENTADEQAEETSDDSATDNDSADDEGGDDGGGDDGH